MLFLWLPCSALLAVSLSSISQTWKHPWTAAAPQTVLIAHCSAVATEPSLLSLLQSCLASSKTRSFHLWAAAVQFILTYFLALLHIMSWYLCLLALHIISCILMSYASVFSPFFVHLFLLNVIIMYKAKFFSSVCACVRVCVCVFTCGFRRIINSVRSLCVKNWIHNAQNLLHKVYKYIYRFILSATSIEKARISLYDNKFFLYVKKKIMGLKKIINRVHL